MRWTELADMSNPQLVSWAETQPWAQAMACCMQDARWHAEGDVWTHTKRVITQLPLLSEWQRLSRRDQLVLTWTALLHDVAKPVTTETDPETGHVSSPKHAVRGEHMARLILRDLGCPLTLREEIARMVRFHGRPVFLLEREQPEIEVIRLSGLLVNRLLYLFALADNRGRDTDSLDRPEDNLHLWKVLAEELECFEQPFPFANDHARFLYYRQFQPNRFYVPFEQYSCTVTMLAGLPGSGKDTWIAQHRPDLPVVSLDEVRLELGVDPTDDQGSVAQLGRERCREYLRSKQSFCFNATNLLKQTRGRWIDLFADYHARIEIVYLEPVFADILRQNKQRESNVPERVIRRLAEHLEPPTVAECHRLTMTDDGRDFLEPF